MVFHVRFGRVITTSGNGDEGYLTLSFFVQVHPVSITVSTNVVSWDISIGSSPFSTARKMPEISMSRSLLVTKWMNLLMLGEESK